MEVVFDVRRKQGGMKFRRVYSFFGESLLEIKVSKEGKFHLTFFSIKVDKK